MMTPTDTALLKHQPDHLQPLSETDRAANKFTSNTQPTLGVIVSWALAFVLRDRHPAAVE